MIIPLEVTKVSEWSALGMGGTIKQVISCFTRQGCQLCKVSP
jgi:hypothetical protein